LLEEISQAAALERIHQLAAILFEAEQEETQADPDKEIDLETLINNQIRQLRSNLSDGSKTAKAIDRGATWEEISESAQEEGLGNLADTVRGRTGKRRRMKPTTITTTTDTNDYVATDTRTPPAEDFRETRQLARNLPCSQYRELVS
jgi:hypothetical protein